MSTSAVAVCCSSASVRSSVRCCSSLNSRTFSIAITAWSAKVSIKDDLLRRERFHLQAVDGDSSNQLVALEHRDSERGADRIDVARNITIFGISLDVGDLHGPSLEAGTRRYAMPSERNRIPINPVLILRACVVRRHRPQHLAVEAEDVGRIRLRTAATALSAMESNTGCKSKAERLITLSTSAVAVCCCSDSADLGARLHLVEQPHVLDCDHRLIGEDVTSSICFSVKGLTSVRCRAIAPIGTPSRRSGRRRMWFGSSASFCDSVTS